MDGVLGLLQLGMSITKLRGLGVEECDLLGTFHFEVLYLIPRIRQLLLKIRQLGLQLRCLLLIASPLRLQELNRPSLLLLGSS